MVDLICILLHALFWLMLPSIILGFGAALLNYIAMSAIAGIYMGAVLVLPHIGLETYNPQHSLSFFERQVRFSRNYASSWTATVLCGGLNLQIVHHLLPHIPYVRLHLARSVIMSYCRAHQLPYRQERYWKTWWEVSAYLRRMSRIIRAHWPSNKIPGRVGNRLYIV